MKSTYPKVLFSLLAVSHLWAGAYAPAALAEKPVEKPHIDLAFCIDTTGSMQSEIDNVKAKMKEIVAKIAGGKPAPIVRVGLVAYRDRGDEYVTKLFPFSDDIDKVVHDISALKADGGGDAPESVNEALHVAVNDLQWGTDKKTLKMLFLIGDAGPHAYPHDYSWQDESRKAIAKGVMINTVGCQGLENPTSGNGVTVFREIAKLTDGKYEPLSYKQQILTADGRRETVLSSAGRLYKMKDASADWKGGASSLVARGAADRVTAVDSDAEMGASVVGTAAAPPASVSGALMAKPSRARFSKASAGYMAGGGSRTENNLSDLVLQATKDAAAKKLNLDFKEK